MTYFKLTDPWAMIPEVMLMRGPDVEPSESPSEQTSLVLHNPAITQRNAEGVCAEWSLVCGEQGMDKISDRHRALLAGLWHSLVPLITSEHPWHSV